MIERIPADADIIDQQRIRDVIVRYFTGLDRKSRPLFERVFTPDAVMQSLGGQNTTSGRDEIIEMMLSAVRNYAHTSHYPTSQVIEIDGDRATGDTFGIAMVVLAAPRSRVLVRGLQYLDEFVRTPEGWRIARRQHIPTWQFEADSLPPLLPTFD